MTNSRRTSRGPVRLMPGPSIGPRPGGRETLLYREIIDVCFESHTKRINTLHGHNVEFITVKPCCMLSSHWV